MNGASVSDRPNKEGGYDKNTKKVQLTIESQKFPAPQILQVFTNACGETLNWTRDFPLVCSYCWNASDQGYDQNEIINIFRFH